MKHLVQKTDEWGKLVFDENGNPVMVRKQEKLVNEEIYEEVEIPPADASEGVKLSNLTNP